jgi:hypothetical protein
MDHTAISLKIRWCNLLILACASANVSNDVRMSLTTSCMFCFNVGLDKAHELDWQFETAF